MTIEASGELKLNRIADFSFACPRCGRILEATEWIDADTIPNSLTKLADDSRVWPALHAWRCRTCKTRDLYVVELGITSDDAKQPWFADGSERWRTRTRYRASHAAHCWVVEHCAHVHWEWGGVTQLGPVRWLETHFLGPFPMPADVMTFVGVTFCARRGLSTWTEAAAKVVEMAPIVLSPNWERAIAEAEAECSDA